MEKLTLIVALATCLPLTVLAQTERDLGSHEHGAALLNVAIDGDELFLELESPWDNLIGFEHTPETEEQHQLFDAAMALLESPGKLFTLTGGNCSLTNSAIESGLSEEDGHADHDDDHDDDHKEHDDHDDDHKEHDDHDDEHAEHDDHDDHADEGTHSELVASYVFSCSSMSDLNAIDVNFLQEWSGFEVLDAQMIGPKGQALQELTSGNISLNLGAIK